MNIKITFLLLTLLSIKAYSQQDANPVSNSMADYTVFCFSQGGGFTRADTQVFAVKPHMNIRTWSQWNNWGTHAQDFKNISSVEQYHQHSVKLIGGVVATVFFFEQAKDSAHFKEMVTRDALGNFVKHGNGAYRGNIANPGYREYVFNNIKLQIDQGVDGIFLDEVLGGYSGAYYNGNEGFDDYHLKDFNKYLAEKYPAYSMDDWITKFGMTKDNFLDLSKPLDDLNQNFNYRKYLKEQNYESNPLAKSNPLSKEWGLVIENRASPEQDNFLSKYTMLYWEDLVKKIREYGRLKFNREILITSNGILPYVDFNSLGMYEGNKDDKGKEAMYVPVRKKSLDGTVSLQAVFKGLYNKSQKISGGAPVVLFIDWPTKMMNSYYNFSFAEKQSYWKIYTAEAYANGLFMAFTLKTSMPKDPTAFSFGLLDFFEEYSSFYKKNAACYHQNIVMNLPVTVSELNINSSVFLKKEEKEYLVHLVNHNYVVDSGMVEKKHFKISLPLDSLPKSIRIKSPDYNSKKEPVFTYENKLLTVTIEKLHYYDVLVVDYREEEKRRKIK
jgi:hypothetical protein